MDGFMTSNADREIANRAETGESGQHGTQG
jgi:hypothetical protein